MRFLSLLVRYQEEEIRRPDCVVQEKIKQVSHRIMAI